MSLCRTSSSTSSLVSKVHSLGVKTIHIVFRGQTPDEPVVACVAQSNCVAVNPDRPKQSIAVVGERIVVVCPNPVGTKPPKPVEVKGPNPNVTVVHQLHLVAGFGLIGVGRRQLQERIVTNQEASHIPVVVALECNVPWQLNQRIPVHKSEDKSSNMAVLCGDRIGRSVDVDDAPGLEVGEREDGVTHHGYGLKQGACGVGQVLIGLVGGGSEEGVIWAATPILICVGEAEVNVAAVGFRYLHLDLGQMAERALFVGP